MSNKNQLKRETFRFYRNHLSPFIVISLSLHTGFKKTFVFKEQNTLVPWVSLKRKFTVVNISNMRYIHSIYAVVFLLFRPAFPPSPLPLESAAFFQPSLQYRGTVIQVNLKIGQKYKLGGE